MKKQLTIARLGAIPVILAASVFCAGCVLDAGALGLMTQSIDKPNDATAYADCRAVAERVDALGSAADRVAQAAAQSQGLVADDVKRADQLNKANRDLKAKCMPLISANNLNKSLGP